MRIKILLSVHYDKTSRLIYFITGRKYTHASIQTSEDSDLFYSFNKKGFKIEKPYEWLKKDSRIKGDIFELEVSEEELHLLKTFISEVENHKDNYTYNVHGVILRLFHIPILFNNKYFCSEFVAEALIRAGIINSCKPSYYYFPNNVADILHVNRCTRRISCLA